MGTVHSIPQLLFGSAPVACLWRGCLRGGKGGGGGLTCHCGLTIRTSLDSSFASSFTFFRVCPVGNTIEASLGGRADRRVQQIRSSN